MGNAAGKLTPCFTPSTAAGDISRHHDIAFLIPTNHPLDDGLGHSFCYIRPPFSDHLPTTITNPPHHDTVLLSTTSNAKVTPFFNTISGASVSANASTSPLTAADFFLDPSPFFPASAASFESSPSFASIPLQPVPRDLINSGPILRNSGSGSLLGSGPIERGFLSGPIERGFMSGPIDSANPNNRFSSTSRAKKKKKGLGGKKRGPRGRNSTPSYSQPRRNRDVVDGSNSIKSKVNSKWPSIRGIKKTILETILGIGSTSKDNHYYNYESVGGSTIGGTTTTTNTTYTSRTSSSVGIGGGCNLSREASMHCDGEENDSCAMIEGRNLQWAQGKAGEDRVHVVVSEESESSGGWVFVGIYDGFNGPDAPDFLLSNLYEAVHTELKGLLWDDDDNSTPDVSNKNKRHTKSVENAVEEGTVCCREGATTDRDKTATSTSMRCSSGSEGDEEVCKVERSTIGRRRGTPTKENGSTRWHSEVMRALSEALKKTEEEYLDIAEKMAEENPELSLMGSCVLVMLMVGEDVYLMNLGDSRAVMGRKAEPDLCFVSALKDLERISCGGGNRKEYETNSNYPDAAGGFIDDFPPNITPVQLTVDHNTLIKVEVERIRQEHEDDPSAVVNGRVKGSLKVTRAFGAGFLKNPKCNEGLLEMFRIDYVGNSPYITSAPSLHHHKLKPQDKFLILSSDGLYQYLTNEEVVSEVEMFMSSTPEGDPAQHLIEEVLFRAAKKSGMDFHELLEIPQGERRKYHDDVSIIIISLEGRIWRSSTM